MDLDAVVAITIADLIVQELRAVRMAVHVLRKFELVVVASVSVPGIVDVGILDNVSTEPDATFSKAIP